MIGGTRVDYWRDTLIKRAFVGGGSASGGVATYAGVQLWNPAASGKLLICERAFVTIAAPASVHIRNDFATLASNGVEGNKYLNEAAPAGQVKFASVAIQGAAIGFIQLLAGDLSKTFRFQHPFIIPEGRGLNFFIDLLNTRMTVNFEWIEA